MFVVAQQELQRMVAGRQRDFRLGLGAAEMQMVEVARDLPIKCRKRRIDQQVMMSAVGLAGARRRQFHSGDAEFHRHLTLDRGAVRRLYQGNTGASRRGRSGLFDGRRIDPDMNYLGHHRRNVRNVSLIT